MNLDEAYRILEVAPGANEETVREARKMLAKVWHPDRHANDPELQKRAQAKLADVNAAFEVVDHAGFPAANAKAPEPAKPPDAPKAAVPPPPAASPPRVEPDFVAPRKIRWSVIFVLAAALGIGAYLAITKLGSSNPPLATVTPDAARTVVGLASDAAIVVVVADAAVSPVSTVRREKTFTLASSRDDVIAAMGQPQGTSQHNLSINGVVTMSAQLTYGESSTIDFDGNDRVIGWTEGDSPLHVRLDIRDAEAAAKAKARGTIAIGSSTDEVLAVLGPPTALSRTRWLYGTSELALEGDKVTRITQGDPKLPQ